MTAHFHPEHPAEEDAFNRRPFAKNLARGLAAPHRGGGLVVAVEGEWGSGKSSILDWVVEELEQIEPKPIVIRFNPWRISGQDTLTETFLTLLAAQIGGESNASNAEQGVTAGKRILDYLKLLRHLKYLKYVPAAGWAGQAGEALADYAENASKAGDAFVDDVRNTLAKDKGIEGLRHGVDKALDALGREVVVVMDDLDRLTRDEIRTVFQLLKAVADFRHITYLLAFDADRVALSLADNGDIAEGRAFVEKIVQVAYPIPPLFPWQATRFAQKHLEQTLQDTGRQLEPFERDRWHKAVNKVSSLARQPRDIARLCNRLRISWPATAGAVNACDVMVYEALSQRFPDFATAIRAYPHEFTGRRFSSDTTSYELDWLDIADSKKARKRWERHLPEKEDNRQLAISACHFLFPYTESQHEDNTTAQWRIADTVILARLLQGTSLEGVADAQAFHVAMANPAELKAILDSLDPASLGSWLTYARQYTPGMKLLDPAAVLETLSQQCAKRIREKTASDDLCRSFSDLAEAIFKTMEATQRTTQFSHLVETAPLSMSHDFLLGAAAECGLWSLKPEEMRKPENHRLIQDEATVIACIARWKAKAQHASDDGTLILEPLLHSILYRWAQLGDKPHYDPAWVAVENLCRSEAGLRGFLAGYPNSAFPSAPDISLVREPDKLLARIEEYPDLKQAHSQFIDRLSNPTARQKPNTFF